MISFYKPCLFISVSKTFLVDLLPAGSLLFCGDSPAKFRNKLYEWWVCKKKYCLQCAVGNKALGKDENISFIDTPEDIRDKYQYFTEANMSKLLAIGYDKGFTDLEDGVMDYVGYLKERKVNLRFK